MDFELKKNKEGRICLHYKDIKTPFAVFSETTDQVEAENVLSALTEQNIWWDLCFRKDILILALKEKLPKVQKALDELLAAITYFSESDQKAIDLAVLQKGIQTLREAQVLIDTEIIEQEQRQEQNEKEKNT